jgi:hypothetical protein
MAIWVRFLIVNWFFCGIGRAEHDTVVESQEALRNLVFLVSSLSTCGFHEVRPMAFSTGSLFQLPNFITPTPLGKGIRSF